MLNGQIVPADQIQAIANLPSREELISKLLYVMQAPMRGLATVLQANIRNLAVVLDQIAKQRGGGAEQHPHPRQTLSKNSRFALMAPRMRLNDSTLFGG